VRRTSLLAITVALQKKRGREDRDEQSFRKTRWGEKAGPGLHHGRRGHTEMRKGKHEGRTAKLGKKKSTQKGSDWPKGVMS